MNTEQIKEFAEKNKLTIPEATLIYGDGTEENIAVNFALLNEVKSGTGNQGNQGSGKPVDPAKKAQDQLIEAQRLHNAADEMLSKGNVAASIRLRRQAYETKLR